MIPLLLGGVMVLLSGCVKRADFEALTNRVTILEASLPEIQEQIFALEGSVSSLEEFDQKLQSSIDDLKSADQSVGERINDLQSNLQGQITDLNTRLSGEVSDLKTATKKNAEDITSLLTTVGAIQGNLEKLGDTYATDAELKAAVDELNKAIEQVKTDLTKTLGDSFNEALKGYATTAALKEVQDELGKIDLDKVKADYEKAINEALDAALANDGKITEKVKEMISTALQSLEKRLAAVEGQVKELLNRIQSIVFVPEYSDGKATINYAKVNSDIIEAQSKLTFQVYPAECAKAFNANGAEKLFAFNFKDVQSRAAGERRLEVAKVVADATTGMVDIYANARDFAAGFYNDAPTVHYAVSLVVDDANEINIASSYVNLIAAKEADAKVITAEVVDAADNAYKIEYVDLNKKDILKGHQLKFKIDGGAELYSLEEMRGMGYDISVSPAVSYTYSDDTKADRFSNADTKAEDHIYATVNLTDKVVKEDVGLMETIDYTYSVGGVEVAAATATVEIVKIQRAIELSVADIKWVYAEDAESDVTGNTFSAEAATLVSSTVPEDTTWETIIAVPATPSIKVDGADATGVTAVFGGTADAKTLDFAGFAWGKTYDVEVVYALPNIDVTVKATIKTVDRAHDVVELKLADESVNIAQNLEFATEAEALTALYDAVKADLGEMTEADYLMEVLVTKTTDLYVAKNEVKGVAYANSKLNIAADGLKAHASYLYSDMTATPDVVEYVYDVTTWYGQQFVITKNVTINKAITTYDFEHVPTWVFENPYKSAITPEYTYSNEAARNASAFSLASIVLNDAFLVKNTVTKETMDNAALAALGITLEYSIEDAHVPSSLLTVNSLTGKYEFTYDTKVKSVNISGHLKLATGVAGEVIELPTQFSNGLYVDYQIEGFNPLEDRIIKTEVDAAGNSLTFVELVEAKEYSTSVWSLLSIKDKRGFNLFENGAWVVGDDANGFANGVKPSDAAIYDAAMMFEIVSVENLPAEQAGKVKVSPESGILTFDYTNKFVAAKPIKVAVKATLEYKYGETLETTLYYTFQTK